MTKDYIIWSYGAGVQSNAIAILIAQGKLPKPDKIVMANTGGERRKVWQYMFDYTLPLLDSLGLTIEIAPHELANVDFYNDKNTLLVPVYTNNGKLPTYCSGEWKRDVVRRYLAMQGIKIYTQWLGISVDELGRCKKNQVKQITNKWPLIMGYGISMTRTECYTLINKYGWSKPPTSACVWCPNRDDRTWQEMKDTEPEDFAEAVKIDKEFRDKDTQGGVYLHKSRKPLPIARFSNESQTSFICDNGECEY